MATQVSGGKSSSIGTRNWRHPFQWPISSITMIRFSIFMNNPAMLRNCNSKGKGKTWICIAPRREHTSKALKYSKRSQGISQFYLHIPRSSANGMNHTCLFLPSRSWYSFTNPERMKGWVSFGWPVRNIWKWVSGTGNWTRTRSPILVLTGLNVD